MAGLLLLLEEQMCVGTFLHGDRQSWGLIEDGRVVDLQPPLSAAGMPAAEDHPSKIVCMGLNFEDYRQILGLEYLAVPQLFLKAPSAIIGPDAAIEIPQGTNRSSMSSRSAR